MDIKNSTKTRHGDQSSLLEHVSYSPARLFLIVAASILVVEIAIMFAFERLPQLPRITESILDGILLTILVSPILYRFLFRPLNMHIAALRQAQELLRQQRDHLEEEVHKP
ncbi:MAG: hypothetical protein Q7U78_01540 [Gallionella sp.]|nr:hypothetical protein [Gallionella sp.]